MCWRAASSSITLQSNRRSHPSRPKTRSSLSLLAGLALQPLEVRADRGEPRGGGDEVLVGLLGAREAGVVAARPHVRGPEEVFFGLVDGEVVGVELMEEGARLLHGASMKPQMARARSNRDQKR